MSLPVISTAVAPSYVQMVLSTVVTFTSGTTIDASGLMSATVVMLLPDGNSTIVNGTVNGNTWRVGHEFTLAGDYEAVLILTDRAGNQLYSPIWQLEVGTNPMAVTLRGLDIFAGNTQIQVLVVMVLLLVGLAGVTVQHKWRGGVRQSR